VNLVGAILQAARPRQWVKNLFVAAALVFSKHLGDARQFLRALSAVAIFSVVSSGVYLWNDLVDVEKDRAHPRKRNRPIASGRLPLPAARAAAATFAAGGLACAALLDFNFALCVAAYLIINVAYSLWLKKVVYVDVLCIASGFILRVLAGGYAIDVWVTRWLVLCTGLLACFLGFGKRAHELAQAGERGHEQRPVLRGYNPTVLRWALILIGLLTFASYVMYTLAPHTVAFFGTHRMVWTAPCALIGLGRFLWLVNADPHADSPTEEMIRDVPFMLNLAVWAAAVTAIIYLR
jgi:decaprenyl-phosphate phosphoribosyltransferase